MRRAQLLLMHAISRLPSFHALTHVAFASYTVVEDWSRLASFRSSTNSASLWREMDCTLSEDGARVLPDGANGVELGGSNNDKECLMRIEQEQHDDGTGDGDADSNNVDGWDRDILDPKQT